jgi:hypothetical protein
VKWGLHEYANGKVYGNSIANLQRFVNSSRKGFGVNDGEEGDVPDS